MSSAKHTAGPWKWSWETKDREWAIVTDAHGSIIANVNTETGPDAYSAPATRKMPAETNARLIAAAPDLLDCAKLAGQTVHRSRAITAPEDVEIECLCERLGYGAVMDAAARLWVRKDPIGALTVGPCVATVQSAIAKAEGRAP